MREREAHRNAGGRVRLDEKGVRALDRVRAIELRPDRRDLGPAEQLGAPGPEEQVVHEMRHGVAEAGIQHHPTLDEQAAGPGVARKIAGRARPERD